MSTKDHSLDSGQHHDRTSTRGRHGSRRHVYSSANDRAGILTSQSSQDSTGSTVNDPESYHEGCRSRRGDVTPRRIESVPSHAQRQCGTGSQHSELEAQDDPVSVDDEGSGRKESRTHRRQESKSDPNAPPRLLIVSSKIKNSMLMQTAVLPNVTFVRYKYETATLENILSSVSQHLGSKKVESIAVLAHSTTSSIYISGRDDKAVTDNITDNRSVKDFFRTLVTSHLERTNSCCRLDFLACALIQSPDDATVCRELEELLNIPVGISRDVTGSDIQLDKISEDGSRPMYVGELYFKMDRLRWSGTHQQSLTGFEKIRTVGKGAYGTAILYRKKDDDSLVILKEINLHDLTASERQMALNEVRVLAMLDHPNIISYYDSFEEDGVVMIEMEYADGGTLAQYLAQQEKPLSEREILGLFAQIVSAIKFIHEHNILHRDFKTPNIFLTKEGRVKVGDFGISKLMSTTNQGANTVLGTPYYISPEMCEGKPYNDKSDIWALGCILYEMACLQRTFEGSNLPALVNKIMKGQFAPVTGNYSQEFKNLIMSMLQREPEFRPSAAKLWHEKLPELLTQYEEDLTTDYDDDIINSSGNNTLTRKRKTSPNVLEKRSVLYYFEMQQMQLTPIALRSRVRIRDVAVSNDHVIVVTVEQMVYTWGQGSKGQLGHGDLESKNSPQILDALKGKSIVRACCGQEFSIFASDNGIVMTCGDGTLGCLGHGDWCLTTRPRLIEALLSVDVVKISCGPQHVVAVGSEGEVFTWGCGTDGRLGLGNEDNVCQPMEVTFDESVCVRECFCGKDGTMLLTDVGSVLACGSNEYNKLGLNLRVGFLMAMKNIFKKPDVPGEKLFCVVRALSTQRVITLHMGYYHSAVIVEPGHVFTFGRNSDGQLGTGNLRQQGGPIGIKLFDDKPAFRVQCGEYFTVAGTLDNDLLFWGTRHKKPFRTEDALGSKKDLRIENASACSSRAHSRQASTTSISSACSNKDMPQDTTGSATKLSIEATDSQNNSTVSGPAMVKPERQTSTDSINSVTGDTRNSSQASLGSGGFRPFSSAPPRSRTSSTSKDETENILQPTPLIRMDSSGSHSQAGDTVTLSQFFCHGENLFIQVETTAPPPKRRNRKKRSYLRKRFSSQGVELPPKSTNGMSASSRDGGDEYSSEASELDASGTIPDWLKQELANSDGDEPDDTTSDHSDDDIIPETSMSSISINRHMQLGPKLKSQRLDGRFEREVGISKYPAVSNLCKPGVHKSTSLESGIEVTPPDHLSSSSSSENMTMGNSPRIRIKTQLPSKKMLMANPPLKVLATTPVITKSKAGPTQAQKPLNRIRAQGKTRRSDPKDMIVSRSADIKHSQESLDKLQVELEQLRCEKQQTESRLRQMESQRLKERESIWSEAEKKASERENQLTSEIHRLREDMRQQNSQLQDNFHVVKTLQEQLEKVQYEQARLSARPDSRQSQRESKICLIQ